MTDTNEVKTQEKKTWIKPSLEIISIDAIKGGWWASLTEGQTSCGVPGALTS